MVTVDTMTNEEEIGSVLEELFYKLRGLGTARKTLKQFRYTRYACPKPAQVDVVVVTQEYCV